MLNRTTFWNILKDHKINIPLIQRGYVLGREDEASKRDSLLCTIHSHLIDNKNLNLDFIYGSVENGTFTPIDGQQRLTTLFLLHWYLSVKENIDMDERKTLNRFEYDARTNSHVFCNALVNHEIELPSHNNRGTLTDVIKNKHWYHSAWNKDSTIQSMLVTIETIHQKFHPTTDDALWHYLTDEESITFDWLDLRNKGYMLSDQLYIKMNARGKQLTRLENFKPKFIQFLAKQYKGKNILHSHRGEVSYADYFSCKIEQEWASLFWEFRDDKQTIDNNLSAYLRFITRLLYRKMNRYDMPNNFNNTFPQYEQVYSIEEHLVFLFDSLNKLHDLVVCQGRVDKESINKYIESVKEEAGMIGMEVGEGRGGL